MYTWDTSFQQLESPPAEIFIMLNEYETLMLTDNDEGVVFRLPDGSSVEVPQATVRRSSMLQEALQSSDNATCVPITCPRGVLRDCLQSIDALKAAGTSTGGLGTDMARNPRILNLLAHLAHLTSVQKLDLSHCHIGADGAKALAAQLDHLASLQHLNLSTYSHLFLRQHLR